MNVLADASLLELGDFFPHPFKLHLFHHQEEIPSLLKHCDILLCRSTLKVNQALLQQHRPRCIATASSGIDHIDLGFLKKANIALFDAKGANARSVADYVLSCIAYVAQNQGLNGRRVGIIGCGAVGEAVAKQLRRFHFEIACFDPPRSLRDKDFNAVSLKEILAQDILCIHPNLHDEAPYPSRHLLGASELRCLRPKTLLINASRGDIVSENALLEVKPPIHYCTDVYANEPDINPAIVAFASLCTPHIAGHSLEAKSNAIRILSEKLHHFCGFDFAEQAEKERGELQEKSNFPSGSDWQKCALSLYNPILETLQMKSAAHKNTAFLELRQTHYRRRDFIF